MPASTSLKESNVKLFLRILTRQGVLFNGEVVSLTSFNDRGPFDVLRKHAQFISIIKQKVIMRLPEGGVHEVPVDNAIMRVKGSVVQVFIGIRQGTPNRLPEKDSTA